MEMQRKLRFDCEAIIEKAILYNEPLENYSGRMGLTDAEKCGDLVVDDCGGKKYIKFIEHHFKKKESPRANTFISEMREIV